MLTLISDGIDHETQKQFYYYIPSIIEVFFSLNQAMSWIKQEPTEEGESTFNPDLNQALSLELARQRNVSCDDQDEYSRPELHQALSHEVKQRNVSYDDQDVQDEFCRSEHNQEENSLFDAEKIIKSEIQVSKNFRRCAVGQAPFNVCFIVAFSD